MLLAVPKGANKPSKQTGSKKATSRKGRTRVARQVAVSVGCGHRRICPWSLMHDPRVYNATVAHVWGVSKRQVKRGKAEADVFERKILVRKVEVEGLAADEQPAPDEELCIYFQDEVRTPESVAARRLQCCPARQACTGRAHRMRAAPGCEPLD